ncbi:hypothetical protein B4140_0028 [Bacillus sp. CN2]|nr:hypothetical protein BAGQ_0094 [Bacillus velezensis]KYC90707.1 hypothetical protein B4140_0028 [Bacillus amyloliquefaciens]GFR57298.1 hypothetical protein B4140_0028 [Bacillus sp. CN2]
MKKVNFTSNHKIRNVFWIFDASGTKKLPDTAGSRVYVSIQTDKAVCLSNVLRY